MKSLFVSLIGVLLATQSFAGTATVLNAKETPLKLLYTAADSADPSDAATSDVMLCDENFDSCLEFNIVGKNDDGVLYRATGNKCLITIKTVRSDKASIETVRTVRGDESCKVKNGSQMLSIDGEYIFEYFK